MKYPTSFDRFSVVRVGVIPFLFALFMLFKKKIVGKSYSSPSNQCVDDRSSSSPATKPHANRVLAGPVVASTPRRLCRAAHDDGGKRALPVAPSTRLPRRRAELNWAGASRKRDFWQRDELAGGERLRGTASSS